MRTRLRNNMKKDISNKTETPILIFWYFLFALVFVWLWVSILALHKDTWSILWASITWVIFFLILWFFTFWFFSENSDIWEHFIKQPQWIIKKWRKNDFVVSYFDDINSLNTKNYYKHNKLEKNLWKQLFWWDIIWKNLVAFCPVSIIYSIWVSYFYTYLQRFWFIYINIFCLILFTLLIYWFSFEYRKYKNTKKKWHIFILRRTITSYYIHENKIFFY